MVVTKIISSLRLLLLVDDSPASAAAVGLLTHISWPNQTLVHVLTRVSGRLPQMESSIEPRSPSEETLELSRWREWARAKEVATRLTQPLRAQKLVVETEIYEGQPAEVALARSASLSTDLIVAGPDMMQKLVHRANCPTLIIRPAVQVHPLSIILAVDESATTWRVVEFLRDLALYNWARVTVINVVEEKERVLAGPLAPEPTGLGSKWDVAQPVLMGYPDTCATEVVRYLHDEGVQGRETVRFGQPADEILKVARDREAVLIVIGANRRVQADPFRLGRVAQRVIREASCSVLVVR
jgi:nucleotide-binding universal stress UspA family protein